VNDWMCFQPLFVFFPSVKSLSLSKPSLSSALASALTRTSEIISMMSSGGKVGRVMYAKVKDISIRHGYLCRLWRLKAYKSAARGA